MWKIMPRRSIWCRKIAGCLRLINVGGHNEKKNIEIVHIIIETLQEMLPEGDPRKELVSKDLITYVEDRKGHDRRYAIAPTRLRKRLAGSRKRCLKRESGLRSSGF